MGSRKVPSTSSVPASLFFALSLVWEVVLTSKYNTGRPCCAKSNAEKDFPDFVDCITAWTLETTCFCVGNCCIVTTGGASPPAHDLYVNDVPSKLSRTRRGLGNNLPYSNDTGNPLSWLKSIGNFSVSTNGNACFNNFFELANHFSLSLRSFTKFW